MTVLGTARYEYEKAVPVRVPYSRINSRFHPSDEGSMSPKKSTVGVQGQAICYQILYGTGYQTHQTVSVWCLTQGPPAPDHLP